LEMVEQFWDANYSAEIMMENTLDPSHLQFVHEGLQGKNIGPRDNTYARASGSYTKVEKIEGGFKGRVTDLSTTVKTDYEVYLYYPNYTVTIINGGAKKMRLCTWVIPLPKNKSRLLFRFYRSFVRFLPARFFLATNDLMAKQDQVVLTGQQMRIEEGASPWNILVEADGLAYEYRKWWDKNAKYQKIWFKKWQSKQSSISTTISLVAESEIEGMSRAQLHPCIERHIEVQEDYAKKVTHMFPRLWPEQYKSGYRPYTLIATSLITATAGYFIRARLNAI